MHILSIYEHCALFPNILEERRNKEQILSLQTVVLAKLIHKMIGFC
jgi:hypothetical protein